MSTHIYVKHHVCTYHSHFVQRGLEPASDQSVIWNWNSGESSRDATADLLIALHSTALSSATTVTRSDRLENSVDGELRLRDNRFR